MEYEAKTLNLVPINNSDLKVHVIHVTITASNKVFIRLDCTVNKILQTNNSQTFSQFNDAIIIVLFSAGVKIIVYCSNVCTSSSCVVVLKIKQIIKVAV